jgi:hypothetical protein
LPISNERRDAALQKLEFHSRGAQQQMMQGFTQALLPVALGVVFVVLLIGLWNMMRGGSANTSQKMMRLRVIAQFVAIMIAMLVLWVASR